MGESYFNILIESRGKKAHVHIGINIDQTLRFQQFRKFPRSVERKDESKKRGLLENKKVIVDEHAKGGEQLVFKLSKVGSSAEVFVEESYLRPEMK